MAPSHPPTTEAQWAEAEARAAEAARSSGEMVGAPERLVETGAAISHEIAVEATTCYVAALAWAFEGDADVTVMFADGVKQSGAGERVRMRGGVGELPFCVDAAGTATISVSAIDGSGAVRPNELLEYALAIGGRVESASETAARRQQDAERSAAARETMDANIAAAEAREARNLENRCRQCREDMMLCRIENSRRRKVPSRGPQQDCERTYQLCQFNKSTFELEQAEDKWPCGEP